jgi:membrane fusion protein, multidrug efflux system
VTSVREKTRFPGGAGAHRARVVRWLLAFFLILTAGCTGDAPGRGGDRPGHRAPSFPVTVAKAAVKDVPVELQAVGTVVAYATVTVRAQVEGEVTSVHLAEGQCVRAGDLLFTIDPRPYEVALKQAQANLEKDKAQLENARNQFQRNAAVVAKGYVSREQYDQAATAAQALAATVQADEAAVENAKIQLAYCAIHSPIAGCAGEILVNRGNVVKANDPDHPLVVIRRIRPIYVGFSVPERYLPDIRKHWAAGDITVLATPAGHQGKPFRGTLRFLDNRVNAATGTILLKATFENGDQALWPGQYVTVILKLATEPNAVVVPSQAVQTGQSGRYVFLLEPGDTVAYRPITVGRTVAGETVIAKGVQPGDRVVTDGQLRLFEGAKVKIVTGLMEPQED